jgi:hypothetical protein
MRKGVIALALGLGLGACTSVGPVDKDVAAPKGSDRLYILGVAPENHRVRVMEGSVEYGVFKPSQWALRAKVYAAPTDGYVVWQGSEGETMGVTGVRIVKEKDDILGRDFRPCGERRTMVFRPAAGAGKVVYLGDVTYNLAGDRLSIRYGENFAGAQAFVERNYPQLKSDLTQGKFELLPTSQSCATGGGTTVVPIYIPRGR